ncbi:hypothetical protein F4802DRAFT_599291 [Xylaria palmicola]|nr:hypothetical protein F4802DRAFT_599291 [Xylaria palmicola]
MSTHEDLMENIQASYNNAINEYTRVRDILKDLITDDIDNIIKKLEDAVQLAQTGLPDATDAQEFDNILSIVMLGRHWFWRVNQHGGTENMTKYGGTEYVTEHIDDGGTEKDLGRDWF